MKQRKLKSLPDNSTFKISLRSKVTYTIVRKEKKGGNVIYTSNSSQKSFSGGKDKMVYPIK